MFYTYVMRSKRDGKWYTGTTSDLRERFKQHNAGKVISTKGRGLFEIIYYEACLDKKDAYRREKYLKSGMGKRYLKNRLKRSLSLTGFTLTEILVVIGMVSIFAAFGMFVSMDFYRSFSFRAEQNIAVSVLMKARSSALANIEETTHGVHFKPDRYILFQGTYVDGNPLNEEILSAPTVTNSGITEVVFEQLTGSASFDPPGANILTITSGVKNFTITLNGEGRIEW